MNGHKKSRHLVFMKCPNFLWFFNLLSTIQNDSIELKLDPLEWKSTQSALINHYNRNIHSKIIFNVSIIDITLYFSKKLYAKRS